MTKQKSSGHVKAKGRLRRLLRYGTIVFVALALGAGALFWYFASIPLPEPIPLAQTTFIYAADGSVLAEISEENRIDIPYSSSGNDYSYKDIPDHVIAAVVAREDRRFFEHSGIDLLGIARAALADARSEGLQGGSTIPQQYVKNVYLSNERSLTRKVKEAVIAVKLSRKYSKEEIMSLYLNTVYFGHGAYGIEAAAREYFSKSARDLTLGEAAFLAGVISSPAKADPGKHPEEAIRRRDATLKAMVAAGFLDGKAAQAEQWDLLKATGEKVPKPIPVHFRTHRTVAGAGSMGHFVELVRHEVGARFSKELVMTGGLRVYTTIDPNIQAAAEATVAETLTKSSDPEVGLVTLDGDGRVVAMIGSRNFTANQVNHAVGGVIFGGVGGTAGRQSGSAFKPIVLAAALQKGFSPYKTYSAPAAMTIEYEGCAPWKVKNASGSGGQRTLMSAMAGSVNTVFAQLVRDVGVGETIEMAKALGIENKFSQGCPPIALGTENVSILELARVYSTFQNDGERPVPEHELIRRVESPTGEVLWEPAVKRKKVLEPKAAEAVVASLVGVVTSGTGQKAKIRGVPTAGKTGTTTDSRDALFAGFTSRYTTVVRVGYDDYRAMANVSGGRLPALIWQRHMARVMEGLDPGVLPGQGKGSSRGSRSASDDEATTTTTGPDTQSDDAGGGNPADAVGLAPAPAPEEGAGGGAPSEPDTPGPPPTP